jgi:hypothetical protein
LIARCRKFANGFDLSGLYDMYEERIELYRAQPPGADWDGVYEAETKQVELPAMSVATKRGEGTITERGARRRRHELAHAVFVDCE